jgi:uncharacterized protein (TIGR00255 family)
MIRSMTGYGRREAAWAGGSVTVEARAVNHRFCEIVIRLPRTLSTLEEELKPAIQQRCARGRIEVTVSLTGGREAEKALSLDRPLVRRYHRLLRDLQQEFKLGGTIDLALLAGFRDILVVSEQPVADKQLTRIVKRLAAGAVSDLDAMRRREGAVLTDDMKSRLRIIRWAVDHIGTRAPLSVQAHLERMKARVEKLLGGIETDVTRLHQELAIYADRCDISEELTRLSSHLAQFEDGLKGLEPVGRTLDFLLQEMGREVNTIGSKANDAEVAAQVVRIKGELEKIREQVQNIE